MIILYYNMLNYRVSWNYKYSCDNISKALLQKLKREDEILKTDHNLLISSLYSDVINVFNQ